ncbi:MAG: NAD-dependent epimerase/dehydratase family protein [Candidatus Aenigmatarchaeota archaeon]
MSICVNRVLVTGGSGFIGSHVVEELLSNGVKGVIIYDRDVSLAKKLFSGNGRVEIILGNILDKAALEEAVGRSDAVIHLAAVLGVESTEKMPLNVLRTNLEGTISALEISARKGVKRFVFASSTEVFGNPPPEMNPLKENDMKVPVSFYGFAKLAGENYCQAYHSAGLHTVAVRPSNTYGPRQRPEWVVPMFFDKVLNGQPPVLFGSGEQKRAFCYVKDTAAGIVKALDAPSGEIINLGGGERNVVSMKELAQKIITLSGKNLNVVHKDFGEGIRTESRDAVARYFSVEKAQRLLGWTPTIDIDEGLRRTFEWYSSQKSG